MFCLDIQPPIWYLFSGEASPLLYYSHFFAMISSLTIGFFVYFKNKQSLSANLLFGTALFFALWLLMDILLWVSVDSRIIVFVWSFINVLEVLVSVTTLYFTYSFLEKRDAPGWAKYTFAILLLPLIVLMHTGLNIKEFDLVACEAESGILQYYFYFIEALASLWLLVYLTRSILRSVPKERTQKILFGLGAILFLVSFSGANIIASFTDQWSILHYGLFGAPVFAGLLAFLIVRYQAFNVKVIGTQALVIGLSVLIGSQLFFVKTTLNYVLVAVTLTAFMSLGIFLVRSVKKEVEGRQKLQELTDRLTSANQELKRLDNAKTEFISIASHQLRTPLTAIKGYVSLILEGSYGELSPTVQDVLNKVYVVNNRMSQLVEDLLNVSRIESGRVQYNFQPTQLEPLVAEIVDMLTLFAKSKGLYLKMKLPKKSLPKLTLDPNKIREVVSNLIDNALKYTKEGGVSVTVEEKDGNACITVADTGIGIRPEDKDRVFQKFTRSSETIKLDVSGTGLGLYVGKNFVEAHKGTLTVESDGAGKGTRFIITLPLSIKA